MHEGDDARTAAISAYFGAEPLLVNATYNKGRAQRLHGAMHALNDDLDSQVKAGTLATDTPRWRAWKRWITNYGKWYGAVPTGITSFGTTGWGTGGVASMLDTYETEMIDWRNWYGKNFRAPPAGQFHPVGSVEAPEGSGIPKKVPAWVWAGLAVGGLFAAASLVKGVRG